MTATSRVKGSSRRAWGAGRAGTRLLLAKTNGALDKARRSVTQKDAFEAFNEVVEDLAQLAAHQQHQIDDLHAMVRQLTKNLNEVTR